MLVFAAPRPKGSEEVLFEDLYESHLTATISKMSGDSLLTNTLQLTSARMRRRERVNSELFRVAILLLGNKITFKAKITACTQQINVSP